MSRVIAVVVLALLHAVLSFGTFLLAFDRGMARFDTGHAATALERTLDTAVFVLHAPFMHLARLAPIGWFAGPRGYLPLLVNSLFWAVAFVYAYVLLRGQRAQLFRRKGARLQATHFNP